MKRAWGWGLRGAQACAYFNPPCPCFLSAFKGRDARYEAVKAQLRARYGHACVNERNKPRLKALARNRGLSAQEQMEGATHGEEACLAPACPAAWPS